MTATPLRILIMSAEMVPFAKTGGLADVVGALPKALRTLGHDARVAMPRYGRIDRGRWGLTPVAPRYPVPMDDHPAEAELLLARVEAAGGGLPVYMVDSPRYFERDGIYMYEDDADRFIFFCRATLEGLKQLGWRPDIIHCHDWHTAIVANWLKTLYRDDPFFSGVACVYTIHNLAYQGIFGHRVLEIAGVDEFGFLAHPDIPHLNDVVDFMGRGIYYADLVNTVSPTYAREILTPEFGEGLDPLLRDRTGGVYGVINGIDTEVYNPASDPHLAVHYDASDPSGKLLCKRDLQRAAGLPERDETPLIGAVSRLADQKGFDLIDAIIEPLLRDQDVQLVLLGTGDQRYHARFEAIHARFPQQCRAFLTFNAALSQKIYAGSDLFLMPSRFEPCGQGQLIALRYGSIPVVRATGGLADTIQNLDEAGAGNGFSFEPYEPQALAATLDRALAHFRDHMAWRTLVQRAMRTDHSWDASARQYVELYRRVLRLEA
ncbi:MAG: glycogen synthase GlgA [Roseiflexaceae bacterium]